jgi:hypothetical protein
MTTSLLDLPNDIKVYLATLLDPISLARLGQTCWDWLAVASRNDLWKEKCEKNGVVHDGSYEPIWKVIYILRKTQDALPSHAFNFCHEVYTNKEVWLEVQIVSKHKEENCMLVCVSRIVCKRGVVRNPLWTLGSKFYMHWQAYQDNSDVGSFVLVKLTTHPKYGTTEVKPPSSNFAAVSLMSHAFSMKMAKGCFLCSFSFLCFLFLRFFF